MGKCRKIKRKVEDSLKSWKLRIRRRIWHQKTSMRLYRKLHLKDSLARNMLSRSTVWLLYDLMYHQKDSMLCIESSNQRLFGQIYVQKVKFGSFNFRQSKGMYRKVKIVNCWVRNMFIGPNMDYFLADLTFDELNEYVWKVHNRGLFEQKQI